jgi:hypothetical protein
MPPIDLNKPIGEMNTDEKVSVILLLIRGNPYNENDKGIVGDVASLKSQVSALNKVKNRAVAWVAGAFAGGGFVAGVIVYLSRK